MKDAKQTAESLILSHYMILFDSDTDKGEEILISILANKLAVNTCNEILKTLGEETFDQICFWNDVLFELDKLYKQP